MRATRLTVEHAFYILAFLLALGLRVFNLGSMPLSDYEAGWGLQALELARGGDATVGANPLYVILTGALFYILGESNAIARLLPALVGSSLVFLPLLFHPVFSRSQRMRIAGVILAFGLALDPGLVTVSRLAGGPMLALGFGLLVIGTAYRRWPIPAGIFAGLALLSGPAVLMGVLGLTLTAGLVYITGALDTLSPREDIPEAVPPAFLSTVLRFAAAVVLLAGTLLMVVPEGLAGFATTLPVYLRGWLNPSGVPALRLPASLLVYQLLVVLFGFAAALRGWTRLNVEGDEAALAKGFSLWAMTALLLALIYPARQVYDLIWMLVPLWGLASLELAHYIPLEEKRTIRLVALGQGLLVFVLLILAWLNFMGVARFRTNEVVYWGVVLGALVMILIATLLVASGWSLRAAQLGAGWGVAAALGLSLISSSWGMAQLRLNSPAELYSLPPAAGQVELLQRTIGTLSQWGTGFRQQVDLAVAFEAPSMRWALRDFANTSYFNDLSANQVSSVIITSQTQNSPALAQSYRGQDFEWRSYPAWEGVLPPDVIGWLAFRQAPFIHEQVILWGRADLFPGGEIQPSEDAQPPAE